MSSPVWPYVVAVTEMSQLVWTMWVWTMWVWTVPLALLVSYGLLCRGCNRDNESVGVDNVGVDNASCSSYVSYGLLRHVCNKQR